MSNTYISKTQATSVAHAAVNSFCLGKPLNRYLCLRLSHDQTRSAVAPFIKHATNWIYWKTGLPPYWVYTIETLPHQFLHLNLLMHVPPHLTPRFIELSRGWVTEVGIPYDTGVLKSQPVRCSQPEASTSDYLCKGLLGLIRYMLKDIHRDAALDFGIRPKPFQGEIDFKRCGCAESLSPARVQWHRTAFPDFPGVWAAGQALRRLRLVQVLWCDQTTGEHRFPIPVPLVTPPARLHG